MIRDVCGVEIVLGWFVISWVCCVWNDFVEFRF